MTEKATVHSFQEPAAIFRRTTLGLVVGALIGVVLGGLAFGIGAGLFGAVAGFLTTRQRGPGKNEADEPFK